MSEIVVAGKDLVRDYHLPGGLMTKARTVHAVKGVSFSVEKGRLSGSPQTRSSLRWPAVALPPSKSSNASNRADVRLTCSPGPGLVNAPAPEASPPAPGVTS